MAHVSIRVEEEDKARWAELARRFGHRTTSDLVRSLMAALADRYESEEWESGLLHLEEDRITSPAITTADLARVYAFPIVAPSRFWRYLKAKTKAFGGRVEE